MNGIATFNGLSFIHAGNFTIQVESGAAAPATIGPINVAGPTGTAPVPPGGTVPAPPVVLSEQLVMAGKGKGRYVAGVVLKFCAPLNPATARNASNYSVSQATSAARAKAIKSVRLRAAYKPAARTVKLTFSGKPRFTAGGELVLIASGPSGISSISGIHLEGNIGNQPGADALYTILPGALGIANGA